MGKSKELATFTDVGGAIDGALTITETSNQALNLTTTGLGSQVVYQSSTTNTPWYTGVAGSAADDFLIYQGATANAGDIYMYTNSYERMRIDASGRVTMPYQPWALVDMGGGAYVNYTGKVPMDNIVQQTGSYYDTTNYRFNCPVAGVYSISWSILSQTSGDEYHVEPHVNGVIFARSYVTYRGNRGYIEYKCAANDYLELYFDNGNYYTSTGSDRYAWACYRLLG